jgi:hypothetical protein
VYVVTIRVDGVQMAHFFVVLQKICFTVQKYTSSYFYRTPRTVSIFTPS